MGLGRASQGFVLILHVSGDPALVLSPDPLTREELKTFLVPKHVTL